MTWVDLRERKPEPFRLVLVADWVGVGRVYRLAEWNGARFQAPMENNIPVAPTHWAELTDPDRFALYYGPKTRFGPQPKAVENDQPDAAIVVDAFDGNGGVRSAPARGPDPIPFASLARSVTAGWSSVDPRAVCELYGEKVGGRYVPDGRDAWSVGRFECDDGRVVDVYRVVVSRGPGDFDGYERLGDSMNEWVRVRVRDGTAEGPADAWLTVYRTG